MVIQEFIELKSPGRGFIDITDRLKDIIAKHKTISAGLCNIFLHHTSASLTICENFDPTVQSDLEAFMYRLAPDGDAHFEHTAEGPDDMPSHIKTVLTQSSISIPIVDKQLALGKWQGIYVWEHRLAPHTRKITVTLLS